MGHNISKTWLWQVMCGVIISIMLATVITAGIAYLILHEYFSTETGRYIIPIIWFVSSMTGTYIAIRKGDGTMNFVPLIVPSILFVILLSAGIFLFDGAKLSYVLVGLISIVLGGGIGSYLRIRTKKSGNKRKRKRYYR